MAKNEKSRKGFKEAWRKFLVSLKKRPHNIALVFMGVTFMVYSLNLTKVSNTTALINKAPMGLCEFIIMLFSMLAFVAFLNAFPRRQPVKVPMAIILYVMEICVAVADYIYLSKIGEAVVSNDYVVACTSMLNTHIVMTVISIVLVALIPVYGKALNKINTSIDVSGNDNVEIELTKD